MVILRSVVLQFDLRQAICLVYNQSLKLLSANKACAKP